MLSCLDLEAAQGVFMPWEDLEPKLKIEVSLLPDDVLNENVLNAHTMLSCMSDVFQRLIL